MPVEVVTGALASFLIGKAMRQNSVIKKLGSVPDFFLVR